MYLYLRHISGVNYQLSNVSEVSLTQVSVSHPQANQLGRFNVRKGKDSEIDVTGKLFDLEIGESVQVQIAASQWSGEVADLLGVSFNDGTASRNESHRI